MIVQIDFVMKLIVATLMGGIIGFERESSKRPAGLKTHILVTVGAMLVMVISVRGFSNGDPARLAAQVVSGIGFLGAGTIIVRGKSIYGLTTAATLWVCACLGLTIGIGFYAEAILSLFVVLFSLWPLNMIQKKLFSDELCKIVSIKYSGTYPSISDVFTQMSVDRVQVKRIEVDEAGSQLIAVIAAKHLDDITKAVSNLIHIESVVGFAYKNEVE